LNQGDSAATSEIITKREIRNGIKNDAKRKNRTGNRQKPEGPKPEN